MIFQDQQKTIQAASTVVLHEDLLGRKKMKLPALDKAGQLQCVNKWKVKNELYLNRELGFKDGPQFTILTGVLFATSSSKHLVPLLQHAMQADGATLHLASTRCFQHMQRLPMGTCPLLHLVCYLEMRTQITGLSFGVL